MKTIRSMKGFLFYLTGVVFVATAVLLLAGCMDPLGRESTAAAGISVMNAPSTVTELELTVSGPGMSTIQRTLTPSTSSITLEVPVGVNRVFDITGGWFTFRRSFSVSPAGLSVPANMGSFIVVPDNVNNRLVVISDLGGSGWREIPYSQLSWVGSPGVVGFDRDGQLLVGFGDGSTEVLMNPDPDSDSSELVAGTAFFTTLNPARNRAYFLRPATNSTIYSLFLGVEGTEPMEVGQSPVQNPAAMAVDGSGAVYVVGFDDIDNVIVDKIQKISSNGQVAETRFAEDFAFGFVPIDIQYFSGHLFVLNDVAPEGPMVLKFTTDLELVGQFGSFPQDTNSPQPGEFFNPRRFLATVPRRLIVVDSYRDPLPEGIYINRLVSFSDIGGTGWRTFGRTGTGEAEFRFFVC